MNKRLNITDKIGDCDSVVIWSANNQDYRGASIEMLIEKIQDGMDKIDYSPMLIQHFNPNTDFALDIENHESGTYLILNPSVSITTGSIKLPERYDVTDGQVVLVASQKLSLVFRLMAIMHWLLVGLPHWLLVASLN